MIKFINISDELPYKIFKNRYEDAVSANQPIVEAVCISSYSSSNKEVNARFVNLKFVNEKEFIFKIVDGKINSISQKKVDTEFGIFKISSSLENWEKHWLKIPPRDFHDLFAMLSKKIIKLDGDLKPLMQNLQYFKDLIASNRAKT